MAGNWIKLRHDAIDAPELRLAARATGLDHDQVLGKMCRLWCWADRGLLPHQVNKRLADLAKAGLVEVTGRRVEGGSEREWRVFE